MLFIYLAHGNYFLASLSSMKQALLPFLLENKVVSSLCSYKSKHIPHPHHRCFVFEMISLLFALPCTLAHISPPKSVFHVLQDYLLTYLLLKRLNFSNIHMWVCAPHKCRCLRRSTESVRSLGAGLEIILSAHLCSGKQTSVTSKSSKHS